MKRFLIAALIAAAGLVCTCAARAQGPPAGASSSTAGGSGSGLPAGPTSPNGRAQFCVETPVGGVAPSNCTWGLAGDVPTDRGSGEASYTFAATDIGTSVRETNVAGETFTIPDGNTGAFVLPVNIGIIVQGGTSTLNRSSSSQIRCMPNGGLANGCVLISGAQYILKETSEFNYTLSVSGDVSGTTASTIAIRDEFIAHLPGTTGEVGDLGWNLGASGTATGAQIGSAYPHVGIEQLASGATASSLIDIRLSSAANIPSLGALGGSTGWTMSFVFKLGQTTNNRLYIGTSDSNNGITQIANGFYLRYDTNATFADAAFKVVTCASSTCTTGGTTYTVDTNWHLLTITCPVSGQLTFTLDANAPQTLATNVATNVQEYAFITEGNDVTASNSFLNVDLFTFNATGVTRFP